MRDLVKSMFRFSWALSLFGARTVGNLVSQRGSEDLGLRSLNDAIERQLRGGPRDLFNAGDRLRRSVLDRVKGVQGDAGHGGSVSPSATPIQVSFTHSTQGPLWPPAEVVDRGGNFVVVGGLLLREVAPGKIVPVPNEKGAIVSKETVPPLKDGVEDFTDQFGAPYRIVRELDLAPDGSDWDLELYSVSCGPFVGDFGGGRPRMPALGESPYNLNSSPRWTAQIAPAGAGEPAFRRPSFPLSQVPILRLDEISEALSIGVPVDPGEALRPSLSADGRERRPITLREYLRGTATLTVTPLRGRGAAGPVTHARFDIVLEDVLPHSVYSFFALHAATFLPPPLFQMPAPLALPNVVMTDAAGRAVASYVLADPFPDPAKDPAGNRLAKIAVIYNSSVQSWGGSMTALGTGSDGHTAMNADLSQLKELKTTRP